MNVVAKKIQENSDLVIVTTALVAITAIVLAVIKLVNKFFTRK